MNEVHAQVSSKKQISPVWIIPIVALGLGLWMVIVTLKNQGPEVTIVFSTAEGIETGKTRIKFRSVDIGIVESAGLGEDLQSVVVKASIDKEAESLIRDDTQFWVVRPRIGKGGVSGLSTVLSGGYIQVAPGESSKKRFNFVGLEEPPVTPAGAPGLKLTLLAEHAGSVSVGDPILYDGFKVGWVESEKFDLETRGMRYGIFVEAPYDDLVTSSSRFWNASGISVSAGADGIEASMGSLETLVLGGVEVGLPEGVTFGAPAVDGEEFKLYDSYKDVNERPHRYGIEYVVEFPQSVRGLLPGAPVEYRGLPAGRVERIMLSEAALGDGTGAGKPIPVLIRLEPARLDLPDNDEGVEMMRKSVDAGVLNGLRATLATGNLLTGSLFVNLDFYPDAPVHANRMFAGRPTVPTIESGLGGIEHRVTALLDKLNEMPIGEAVSRLEATLANLNQILASDGIQQLPATLDDTLKGVQDTLASFSEGSELQARLLPAVTELERTLSSLRQLLTTLEEQPNALIFNREYREDPRPPAGAP